MKKKEITLQDIFDKMEELNSNFTNRINHLSDCVRSFCEIDNTEVKSVESHDGVIITDKDYITITADDVYVGGAPAREYHGQEIYSRYFCPAYFKEARDTIREEYGYELLEIHCLQSSTDGEYAKSGNPVPDEKGKYCWVRVKYKDKYGAPAASLWVFGLTYSSASDCASGCANNCGGSVRYNSDMRSGLFGSVRN